MEGIEEWESWINANCCFHLFLFIKQGLKCDDCGGLGEKGDRFTAIVLLNAERHDSTRKLLTKMVCAIDAKARSMALRKNDKKDSLNLLFCTAFASNSFFSSPLLFLSAKCLTHQLFLNL